MSTLGDALKAAGIAAATAEDRLAVIIAWVVRENSNFDAAKDALFAAVRTDAELLWVLFKNFRRLAATEALQDAFLAKRERDRPPPATVAGGGAVQGKAAGDAGQRSVDRPVPKPTPKSAEPPPSPSLKAGIELQAAIVTRSLLDTMQIDGVPLGDVTPVVARAWAAKRYKIARHNSRFISILTENLPPEDPIRKWRKPEEVQAVFEKVEAGDVE